MTSPHLASLLLFVASPPAIDAVRQSLSAHSDLMFRWLVISSIVTGVGVIFEAPGELHELARWWGLKRLKKSVGWSIPVTFFGLLLVIGGIIGEGIFEYLSADAETAIRQHDEGVLGETIIQAGTAKDSADAAARAADRASKASDEAMSKANSVLGIATKAGESARGALVVAGDARSGAEKANKALADRALSDAQVAIITSKLRGFAGQKYKVVPYWDSHESLGIANRINAALLSANWKYFPPPPTGVALMGGIVGVQVWHHPNAEESTKLAADGLIRALNADGILAYEKVENSTNNPKHNDINLSVGTKR